MIIDDGMTMVIRAARINPQYEGNGLYRMLDDNLTDWAKSRHVTVKAKTTTELNSVVAKPSFQQKNQRIDSRVCILSYNDPYWLAHERNVRSKKSIGLKIYDHSIFRE